MKRELREDLSENAEQTGSETAGFEPGDAPNGAAEPVAAGATGAANAPDPMLQSSAADVPDTAPQSSAADLPDPELLMNLTNLLDPSLHTNVTIVPDPMLQSSAADVPDTAPQSSAADVPDPELLMNLTNLLDPSLHTNVTIVPDPALQSSVASTLDSLLQSSAANASDQEPQPSALDKLDSAQLMSETEGTDAYDSALQSHDADETREPPEEEFDINEKHTPAVFEPIPPEKLARAKRIKRMLIAVIVLLVLVLVGAAGTFVYFYLTFPEPVTTTIQDVSVIESDDDLYQDRGGTETTEMPNLVQMIGRTPEQVVAALGPEYVITKSDVITEPETPEEAGANEGENAENAENAPVVTQVVTISYTPEEQTSTVGAIQVQNIYLSLDENGIAVEVYFVSSMNLLDFPISSFADLVATPESFLDTLNLAGAFVAPEFHYTAPAKEEYTEYVDPDASVKRIRKESVTMKGALASAQPPTYFEITYTFDYGASGVEDTPSRQPAQRMLYIKLR